VKSDRVNDASCVVIASLQRYARLKLGYLDSLPKWWAASPEMIEMQVTPTCGVALAADRGSRPLGLGVAGAPPRVAAGHYELRNLKPACLSTSSPRPKLLPHFWRTADHSGSRVFADCPGRRPDHRLYLSHRGGVGTRTAGRRQEETRSRVVTSGDSETR
jgi:hypothetical protein